MPPVSPAVGLLSQTDRFMPGHALTGASGPTAGLGGRARLVCDWLRRREASSRSHFVLGGPFETELRSSSGTADKVVVSKLSV